MKKTIPLEQTQQFSTFFLDYIREKQNLLPFYSYLPNKEGINEKIKNFRFPLTQRKFLVDLLNFQYEGFNIAKEVKHNVSCLLNEDCYTVTTGHQLNIFSGPLYFIYKIASTIQLAKSLSEIHPSKKFVPVYWMASEDHDFEEINNFILFGKTYIWESNQKGPVGRFMLEGLENIISQINDLPECFIEAYRNQPNLVAATRYFVNELFGKYGLVIVDGDHRGAKKQFQAILKDELLNQSSEKIVSQTNKQLEELGYKPQAFVRPINIFYMLDGLRERITLENKLFSVHNTNLSFSETEIIRELEAYPERFSPNVILRPLYQETLLPNLAYIGGPSEIIYWLQLKDLFQYFQKDLPVLMPRNFAMYFPKNLAQKLVKLKLKPEDIFLEEDTLKNKTLENLGITTIELDSEKESLDALFLNLGNKAILLDKTLDNFIKAEFHKAEKILEEIEKKFKKAEEKKNEELLKQAVNLRNKLLPNGELQERIENYLTFAINQPDFLDKVISSFDPFDTSFYLLLEDE